MGKDELRQKIREMEKQVETAKKKREAIVIVAFAVVYYLFFLLDGMPDGLDEFFSRVLSSIFVATINYGVSSSVFEWLHKKEEDERKTIKFMKEQLDDTTR